MPAVKCAHCDGSGVCKRKDYGRGYGGFVGPCYVCLEASGRKLYNLSQSKDEVLCSICNGVGHVWVGPRDQKEA